MRKHIGAGVGALLEAGALSLSSELLCHTTSSACPASAPITGLVSGRAPLYDSVIGRVFGIERLGDLGISLSTTMTVQ